MDADGAAFVVQTRAKLGQSELGMIARADRLDTDVTPSVNNPARRTADFTCALGTGSVYSMGERRAP